MKQKYGKRKSIDIDVLPPMGQKDVWGVPNFLPERVPGEDESSLAVHVNRLKQQHELPAAKRNNENIKVSMRKTFPEHRRKLIVDMMSIEDLLLEYPTVSTETQVYKLILC